MSGETGYRVDPADPRAPSDEIWAALSNAERAAVVAALPSEVGRGRSAGDTRRIAIERTKDALSRHFERTGRRVYVSSKLAVQSVHEPDFVADLVVVLDVHPHPREKWLVGAEGGGPDFVLEVDVGGARADDVGRNLDLCARLGIREFFVFDPVRMLLDGFALPTGGRAYAPVPGQQGRFHSRVLGLDVGIEDGRLRFFFNGALVPETREFLDRAERLLSNVMANHDAALRRAEEAEAGREEERRAREEERRAREEAEARLSEALAEIERLKGERNS